MRRTAKGPRLFSPGPFALVPVVGVEPTRVISTRDFESPSSAIPTHRLIVYVIIAYLRGKIKRKVSLFGSRHKGRVCRRRFTAARAGYFSPGPACSERIPSARIFPFCTGSRPRRASRNGLFVSARRPGKPDAGAGSLFHAGRRPAALPAGDCCQRGIYGVISGRSGASFFKKDFTNEAQLYII